MADSRYGVVFCGGGPAATGIIVCAAANGRLDELLSHGVCIVEQGAVIGPGALAHYPISANTRGVSFLRALQTAQPRSAFDPVGADPATQALGRLRHVFPRLPLVGRHLESMGRAVHAVLEASPGCAVVTGHAVREVRLLAGGGVSVAADPLGGGSTVSATADHAVIAMGGTPRRGLDELRLLPGLDLRAYAEKVCHTSDLLDDRIGLAPQLRRAIAESRAAVVIGGSHSAWSAAWMLVHDPGLWDAAGRPPTVMVLHRSPLRFSFRDIAQGRAAGYVFDETRDVCPLTGMVHRHGGLRADARALAWAATRNGEHGPVRALALVDEPRSRAAVALALDEAGAIIAGVGYQANVPTLCLPDGSPLRLGYDDDGVQVNERGELMSAEGMAVSELMALGLGAGLQASGELAAEPAYAGRVDAVSLYQAEVGRIVLDSLLGGRQS